MEKQKKVIQGTFVLALLTGFCLSASYTTLFYSSIVSFSIFPFIGSGLAIYCLHQQYLSEFMTKGTAIMVILFSLLGFFSYSAVIRVEFPALGNNLFQSFIVTGLIFWIYHRLTSSNTMKTMTEKEE